MSKRFFPCETTSRSRNYSPFQGPNQTGQSSRNLQTQGPIHLTWSSASSSSRSNPVAMGMTSSTLVAAAAGLSAAETRQSTSRSAPGTATKTRSGEGAVGPYRRGGAQCGGRPRPPWRGERPGRRPGRGARRLRRQRGGGRGLGFGGDATWCVRVLSGHGGGLLGGKGNGVGTRARRAGSI